MSDDREREQAICENVVDEILQAHIDQMNMSGIIMRTRQAARDEKPDMAECFNCGQSFSSVGNVSDLIQRERATAAAEARDKALEEAEAAVSERRDGYASSAKQAEDDGEVLLAEDHFHFSGILDGAVAAIRALRGGG